MLTETEFDGETAFVGARRSAAATRRRALAGAAALAALACGPARGAPPAPAPAQAQAPAPAMPPNTVAPVTVMPNSDPPKLASSFPAAGEAIAPGVLVLRLTFDQKMLDTGFDFAAAPGARMPDCLKTPRLLNDGKTFVLLCTTAPNSAYSVALNPGGRAGFANVGGRRAEPSVIAFSTNNDEGPRTLADALKVAKLTEIDVPIAVAPSQAGTAAP